MIKREKYAKISVLLLIAISIFMVINGNRGKKVVSKNELTLEERQFAIYKDDGLGNYVISNDTSFPTKGYLLNMEKTKCFDSNNNGISNNIVSQSLDGKITLQATQASYCDLYFTKDDDVPVVTTFSITGTKENNATLTNGYTHKTNVTYNIEWTANDVVSYCISTSQSSCNGSWIEVTVTSVSPTTPALDSTEGLKKVYAFIKDKANNISSSKEATITLDLNNPTVTSVTYKSKDTSSITVTVEGNDTPTGSGVVTKQCKATTQSTWYDQDENGNCKVKDLLEGTEYTIEGRVIDASGRVSTNTDYTKVTETIAPAYSCDAGETLVQDSQKGSSSGGYICTASASSKGWYSTTTYYTCSTSPGTRYDSSSSASTACQPCSSIGYFRVARGLADPSLNLLAFTDEVVCKGSGVIELESNCGSEGLSLKMNYISTGYQDIYVCTVINSGHEYIGYVGTNATEPGGNLYPCGWSSAPYLEVFSCRRKNSQYSSKDACISACGGDGRVSTVTERIYYCDEGLGWNVFSGNNSTLQCYRAATNE